MVLKPTFPSRAVYCVISVAKNKMVMNAFRGIVKAKSGIFHIMVYHEKALNNLHLYNSQINARALIGQSVVGYCAGKPTEKPRVF